MESENALFVGEVEKYPELYDFTNAGYSIKDIVERAWTEVGRKFNLTANESKEKWRNIRNTFVKYLRPPIGGMYGRKKKTYYLSEAMKFTIPFLKVTTAQTGVNTSSDISVSESLLDQPYQHLSVEYSFDQPEVKLMPSSSSPSPSDTATPSPSPHSTNSRHQQQQPPLSPTTAAAVPNNSAGTLDEHGHVALKRKRNTSAAPAPTLAEASKHIAEYFSAKRRYIEAKNEDVNLSSQADGLKMFFLSLIHDLDRLPSVHIRRFKRRVLDLVEETIELASIGTRVLPKEEVEDFNA